MNIRRAQGFTLVELMIVVVVIGILASIAYPSYSEYVQRSHIAEATSNLADMRIRQERYFQDHKTYVSAGACGAAPPANDSFAYTCVAPDANSYVVTATGGARMAGFAFNINQDNLRQTTASPWATSTPKDCWITKKGESC